MEKLTGICSSCGNPSDDLIVCNWRPWAGSLMCRSGCNQLGNKLSEWRKVADVCSALYDHRGEIVAFIEKTPRIYNKVTKLWEYGPKGVGDNSVTDAVGTKTWGFYEPSKKWCETRLIELGYTLNEEYY